MLFIDPRLPTLEGGLVILRFTNKHRFACLMTVFTCLMMMQPALAEEIDLQFELPVSEVLTYRVSTTLYQPNEPAAGLVDQPMLELSAIFNIEIEPENAHGVHPFTYWFDTFEVNLYGLPFNHLLGPEKWSGVFTPQRELLDVEEPPILSELGIIMALVLSEIFVPEPQEPLAVGDTWELGYHLTTGISELEFDISLQYTLVDYDLETGTAQLLEKSISVYESVLEASPGVAVIAAGEITSEGESTIDLRTGLRLRLTGRSVELLRMSLPIPATNGPAASETFHILSESSIERIWPTE